MSPKDEKNRNGKRNSESNSEDEHLTKKAKMSGTAPDQQTAEIITGMRPGSVGEDAPTRSSPVPNPNADLLAFPSYYYDERVCDMLLHPLTFNDLVYDLPPRRGVERQPAFMSGALPQTDHTAIAVSDDDGYGMDAVVDEPPPVYPAEIEYPSDTDADREPHTELQTEVVSADLATLASKADTMREDSMHDIPLSIDKGADRKPKPQEAVENENDLEDSTRKKRQEELGEKVARELQIQCDAEMARGIQDQDSHTPAGKTIAVKSRRTPPTDDGVKETTEKELREALGEQAARDLDKQINQKHYTPKEPKESSLEWALAILPGARHAGHFKDLMEPEELDLIAIALDQALSPNLATLEDYNLTVKALRKLMEHWSHGRLETVPNIHWLCRGFQALQEYLHQNKPAGEEDTLSTDQPNDNGPASSIPDVLLVRQAHNSFSDSQNPHTVRSARDADMEAALLTAARMDIMDAIASGDPAMAPNLRGILACLDHVISREAYKEAVDTRRLRIGYGLLLDGINKGWVRCVSAPECLDAIVRAFKEALQLAPVDVQRSPGAVQTQRDNNVVTDDEPSNPPGSVADHVSSLPTDDPADDAEWDLNLTVLAMEELQEATTFGKLKVGLGLLSQIVDCLEKVGNSEIDGQLDESAASVALSFLRDLTNSDEFQEVVTPEYLDAAIRVLERAIQPEHTERHSVSVNDRTRPATNGSDDTAYEPAILESADVGGRIHSQTDGAEPEALDCQLASDALKQFRQLNRLGAENPLHLLVDGSSIDAAIAALGQALGRISKYEVDEECLADALDEFEANQAHLEGVIGSLIPAIVVEALRGAKPTMDGNLSECDDDLFCRDHQPKKGHTRDHALAIETLQKLRGQLCKVVGRKKPAMDHRVIVSAIDAVSHVFIPGYQLKTVDMEILRKALRVWQVFCCYCAGQEGHHLRQAELVCGALRVTLKSLVEKAAILLDLPEDPAVLDRYLEPKLRRAAVQALHHAGSDGQFDVTVGRGDLTEALHAFGHAEKTGLLEVVPQRWIVPVAAIALKRAINLLAWQSLPCEQPPRPRLPSRYYPAMDLDTGAWIPPPPLPYSLSGGDGTAHHLERAMTLARCREVLVRAGLQGYADWDWELHPDNPKWPIKEKLRKEEAKRRRKKRPRQQYKLNTTLRDTRDKRMIKDQVATGLGLANGEQAPGVHQPPFQHRFSVAPGACDGAGDSHCGINGAVHQPGDCSPETEKTATDVGNRLIEARDQLVVKGDAERGNQRRASSVDTVRPEGETGKTPRDSEELPSGEKQAAEFLTSSDSSSESSGDFFHRLRRECTPERTPDSPRPEPVCYERADTPAPPSRSERAGCAQPVTQVPSLNPRGPRRIGGRCRRPPPPSLLRIVTSADDIPEPPQPSAGKARRNGLTGGGPNRFLRSPTPKDSDARSSTPAVGRWGMEDYGDPASGWGDYAFLDFEDVDGPIAQRRGRPTNQLPTRRKSATMTRRSRATWHWTTRTPVSVTPAALAPTTTTTASSIVTTARRICLPLCRLLGLTCATSRD